VKNSESGFTIPELLTVIVIIGVLISIVAIYMVITQRRTAQQSIVEILKQEIRNVYAMADSAEKNGAGYRYKYRMEFKRNDESPPTCYRIMKGESADGTTWTWSVVPPVKGTSYKIVDQVNGWIQLGTPGNTYINSYTNMNSVDSGANYGFTLVSKGSIVEKEPVVDSTIVIRSSGQPDITVTVNQYGSVTD